MLERTSLQIAKPSCCVDGCGGGLTADEQNHLVAWVAVVVERGEVLVQGVGGEGRGYCLD